MNSLRQRFVRHRAWLIVGLTILLVLTIRVRLRQMPLERDEGEYAYAGQLILQGVPPYKEAYNMKLPGTYAAYALIMAVFGQSDSAIHIGVALINAASIVLIFLIGRKILDEPAGVVAAISYALLSTSPSVLGLAGHATHFVVLPALAGTLLLLRAREQAHDQILNPESNRREQREQRVFTGPIFARLYSSVCSVISCSSPYSVFLAGLLFGLAFLMKQHGVFFGIFGGLYLAFSHIYEPQSIKEKREHGAVRRASGARDVPARSTSVSPTDPRSDSGSTALSRPLRAGASRAPRYRANLPPIAWPRLFKELALFSGAFALPYLLTCLILWAAGVFPQFTFWTITYARKYATALPSGIGNDAVRTTLDAVSGANVLLWILPWLGALLMSWERRVSGDHRFLLVALLLCSLGSISVGFYFREHYFITLLPVMALLTGLAVSRAIRLVKHDITIELFLAIPIFLLFGLGCLISLGGNGPAWFAMSPVEAVENTYHTTLFNEARKLADYIKNQTPENRSTGSTLQRFNASTLQPPRIAVLGSEPEIYFYSRRRSATGYIYMYPLMETHPYAAQMQQELISQIETNNPDYIVYLDFRISWLGRPESPRVFDRWWQNYSTNLELVQTIPIQPPTDADLPQDIDPASLHGNLLLYRPKADRR